jgi:hypothetical protein
MTGDGPADGGLLDREATRRRQAHRVLADLDVLGRWAAVGDARLCGALAYRVLVAPDIDLEVFGRLDRRAGFAVVAGLAERPGVRKVTYLDATGDDDAGLGWEVVYRAPGGPWHVQMWLLPADYPGPRSCDLATAMRARLAGPGGADERRAILRVKEDLVATRQRYRSIDVYRAVLDGGVRDPAAFRRWNARHASTGLLSWRPAVPATSGPAPRYPAAPVPS